MPELPEVETVRKSLIPQIKNKKIKKIVISLKKDKQLIVRAKTNADITLERWSFNKRAQLFQDVFGIKVSLKQEGMNRR